MKIVLVSLMFACSLASGAAATDPGTPDTIKLVGDTLILGQSVPIELVFVNDEEVSVWDVPLELRSLDGGFAVYDSIVYINRMDDPMAVAGRYITEMSDGISPDSIYVSALRTVGSCLPAGNDAVARVYFTGTSEGHILADSIKQYDPLRSTVILACSGETNWSPEFVTNVWTVIVAPEPPVITCSNDIIRIVGGTLVNFQIDAESPGGSDVTLELLSFTGNDAPTIEPTLSATLPATFEWQATSDDIGIWKAEFQACDTDDKCAMTTVNIQVVEDESYLISFTTTTTQYTDRSLGIALGNFDIDPYPELVSAGWPYYFWPSMSLYDFDLDDKTFQKVFAFGEPSFSSAGLQTGFINNDNSLDVIAIDRKGGLEAYIEVWRGRGGNDLELLTESSAFGAARPAVLTELTGDQYLDYAVGGDEELLIYASSADYSFTELNTISVPDLVLTINSADFDQDGHNDLAVGTTEGVQIYLNDGSGAFATGEFYAQVYSASDLEVTNNGSDFNSDGLFDLCVSTPSTGATYSEIYVYLGAGDGSFEQRHVRTLEGFALGNCIGDFNNDNELDIAYIDGGEGGVGILYGDGNGDFTNETRFYIDHQFLAQIACTDIDLDGDFDIVVIGQESGYWLGNAIFLLENQLDPSGFAVSSLETMGLNNVDIELTSSSGKVLNSVKSTMPAADMYRRSIDDDETIDAFARVSLLESGVYRLTATPRPELPAGETFSLEYAVDGVLYRLVSNAPMTESGYQFDIYPAGGSPVVPAPGVFTADNPVAFQWTGDGQFDFQLASDIEFTNLLADVTVDGNSFVGPELSSSNDTATFYWRVLPAGVDGFETIYPINVLFGQATDVNDPDDQLPGEFGLSQNYPNPFNPFTRISFALPEACHVRLDIYNINGRKIRTLADKGYPAGEYTAVWDSKNNEGQNVASGIYLYKISSGTHSATKKMILLK